MIYFKYWRTKLNALYANCAHEHCCEPVAVDLPDDWNERLLRIAKEMHEERRTAGQLSQSMITATYNALDDARLQGRSEAEAKVAVKLGDAAGPDPAVLKMQANLFKFSGAKTFNQLTEMNSALVKGGKKQSWEDFRDEVLAINKTYNTNHLQAEWQTVRQSAHHARNWEHYEKQQHLFPNLKYKTVGDARVRDEHSAINNTIAPLNDAFWDKYYPPNGWRCRCYVVQSAEPVSSKIPTEVREVKPEFRINVGKMNEVFPEAPKGDAKPHTYFAVAKKIGGEKLRETFERSKLAAPYTKVYTAPNKATVSVSPFVDSTEIDANFNVATKIADQLGLDVALRPHLDGEIMQGWANPEYDINGLIADRKSPQGKRLSNILRKAEKQGCGMIVFDLEKYPLSQPDLMQQLKRNFEKDESYATVKEVITIDRDGVCKHYLRKDIK